MTDAEWLAVKDPTTLLFRGRFAATVRKLRLFACACCRRIEGVLADDRLRALIDVAEQIADGTIALYGEAARTAQGAALDALHAAPDEAERVAGQAIYLAAVSDWMPSCANQVALLAAEAKFAADRLPRRREMRAQAALVRDVFGNPPRPVPLDPRWRTPDVVGLACAIYEDRAFDRLPLLADALMDAGCADEQVLGHCRLEGPHARGCWVVDLALGKE